MLKILGSAIIVCTLNGGYNLLRSSALIMLGLCKLSNEHCHSIWLISWTSFPQEQAGLGTTFILAKDALRL